MDVDEGTGEVIVDVEVIVVEVSKNDVILEIYIVGSESTLPGLVAEADVLDS